jgi:predicted DCC family thiol-disulfide oxidoreductase YuxK
LCDGFIQWVAKADRKSVFKFAPLSGVTADREGIELSNNSNEWTIVLSDGENTYGRSSAVIEILKDLPKWDFVGDLLLIVPRFIRDFGYRCVATVRYRLFGTVEVCGLPPQELRAKLLP